MVGGNQLYSRREQLREFLELPIDLSVFLGNKRIDGKCILEYRKPNEGYFIANSDAQIYLKGIRIMPQWRSISLDLSKTLVQSLRKYEEALGN